MKIDNVLRHGFILCYISKFLLLFSSNPSIFSLLPNTLNCLTNSLSKKLSFIYKCNIKNPLISRVLLWSGNMGNLPVVIIPAICDQKGGPFGAPDDCRNRALSYSFCSLAVMHSFLPLICFHHLNMYMILSSFINCSLVVSSSGLILTN